ncbi:MAG: branched-chain amino acid ABC transporter permease [Anaerovoracaceae bacterium]|jgi:branched-chain amino acid transport system permease protein
MHLNAKIRPGFGLRNLILSILICGGFYALMKIFMLPGVYIITPFYLVVLQKIFIDAMLGLGLNLITGITGQFSLGHAGFMAIGAYTAALMTRILPINIATVFLICIIAMVAGGLAGFLIGIPTLRLKGDYLAIATLGFAEIIRLTIQNVDQSFLGGASGLSALPRYTNFEWSFFGLVFCYFICRNFINSSYGRACISVREDEVAAEAMGIPLMRTKIMAFILGTMLAGFAGALYMGNVGYIAPKDFAFMKSIEILIIVVIGGLGSIRGTLVGAVLLNIVSVLLQDFAELRMVFYALVLIIFMLFKSGETPFFVKCQSLLRQMIAVIRQILDNISNSIKAIKS